MHVRKLIDPVQSVGCLAVAIWALPLRPAWSHSAAQVPGVVPINVVTFHYSEARLGWNSAETQLTPSNVGSRTFGKLWETKLDGAVPGSPLYMSGTNINGQLHDVVYAATECNSVYALDATTGKILWRHARLREPLTDAQFTGSWFGDGKHGILSTPVIDPLSGTLYTCTIAARGLRQFFEVWALDIRTGELRGGWPVTLRAAYKGIGFAAGQVMQRGALSLIDGWVYIPFGGRWDTPPWRGWLIGVDARHPDTTQRSFCSSPFTDGAGIWSGGGVAADTAGNIYAATGNGDFDGFRGGDNLAESVVRLHTSGVFGFDRDMRDFYTPANYKFLDDEDEDLGGATVLVLPDQPATSTPHLLFTCGKDGLAYLLNRDSLGGIGGEIQKLRLFSDPKAIYHEGIRSTSAYYDAGAKGRYIYVAGDQPGPSTRGMVCLRLGASPPGNPLHMSPVWTLKQDFNGPSSPVVSSNRESNAIVWLVETNDGEQSALRAYNALTGVELYNSNKGPGADRFTGGRRFTSPIVANGRVFVGASGVVCYGLAHPLTTRHNAIR